MENLEGLIWSGQDIPEIDANIHTGLLPQPFTPAYAKFLGEYAEKVEARYYGEALNEALNLAGKTGFVLSTADLSYARKEIRANGKFRHDDGITGLTYEVAGIEEDLVSGNVSQKLLVIHGLDLVTVGVHVSRIANVDNVALEKSVVRSLQVGTFKGQVFNFYDPSELVHDRIYGVKLPFEECTKEHFIKSQNAKAFNPHNLRHESARAGIKTDFVSIIDEHILKYGKLYAATTWIEESALRRIFGKMRQDCEVKPVTNYALRNVSSSFNNDATFAVIPDGVIK